MGTSPSPPIATLSSFFSYHFLRFPDHMQFGGNFYFQFCHILFNFLITFYFISRQFVSEYFGVLISLKTLNSRMGALSANEHLYAMQLNSKAYLDSRHKGNIHSSTGWSDKAPFPPSVCPSVRVSVNLSVLLTFDC